MQSVRQVLGLFSVLLLSPELLQGGTYVLAFWREAGAYENQSPPAGEFGNHSAFVHVWDESGQPLSGKQIYTSWGVLLGTTDANGFTEIELRRPNGYDFQIRDGSHLTHTTPVLSVERAPTWGHYSFEIGFMFKQDSLSPATFDTNYYGTINATGSDPCSDLSAPQTRSLAFSSTAASNYCSDAYALGNWAASHGQTFVATGNRVVAAKAMMAAGFTVHNFWTAQILEGGPSGAPIGPPRSTRLHLDTEYYPILVKWGINDVQVVPGRTYYLKITRDEGINAYRVNANNYGPGNYFQDGVAVPGLELMGAVVCASYTNSGATGTLTGYVVDTNSVRLSGALVTVTDAGLYSTSDAMGQYTIPFVPIGKYDVSAMKSGYITRINSGVIIQAGEESLSDFILTPAASAGNGLITTPGSVLQPFEIPPAWNSSSDATWGSGATFSIVNPGRVGNCLQAVRGGAGSSARVQVLPVRTNTPYQIAIWIRCPSYNSSYWAESAFKLGTHTAYDFDNNASSWTMIKKFDSAANGNGNTWTRYSANFNSGTNLLVSVGFKLGANPGTGPTVQWDELSITSLIVPPMTSVFADAPTRVVVRFLEPVSETTATNLANYQLYGGGQELQIVRAARLDGTNVVLTTARQSNRVDYVLTVSNVAAVVQPAGITGRNGQAVVRVPYPVLRVDDQTLWRYLEAGTNTGVAWRLSNYDDSTWSEGPALFGYGGVGPSIRTGLTVDTNRVTVYFRKTFTVPETFSNAFVRLRPIVDDGAVMWLNGPGLFRIGMPSGAIAFNTRATRTVGIATYEGPFDITSSLLVPGTNLLAVEVHQVDPASPDVVFGLEVEALVLPSQLPPPALTIARLTNAVRLTWFPEAGLTLEHATNILGPWVPQSGQQSVVIGTTNRTSFFRLRN